MRNAERDAFNMVPETCPNVDSASGEFMDEVRYCLEDNMDKLIDVVKTQTTNLQSALITALRERDEALDEIEDLKSDLNDLTREVQALEQELQELQSQVFE